MSADLTWLLIKNNNSFLIKRSGVQFSSEAGNLLNKNSFKFSGLANNKTVGIEAAASGRGVVLSTKKSGVPAYKPAKAINKVTLSKGIRKSARSVAGLTRAGYRADLRKVRFRSRSRRRCPRLPEARQGCPQEGWQGYPRQQEL
ncbi:MAG: ribosomal L28e protein family-domain-containing protein, partial [Podila humilis]